MSFELSFWSCGRPLDADEAAAVYYALQYDDQPEPLISSPAVASFWTDLTAIYPPLEELSDEEADASPWCGGEEVGDCHVTVTLRFAEAREMARRLLLMAQDHRLTCYDPQGEFVYLSRPLRERSDATLTSPWLLAPFPACTVLIRDLLPRLAGREDPFAILERGPETYMQTLWNADGYLLEYRDGSVDRHFQAMEPLTVQDVTWAMQLYATGDDQWRHEYSFQRYVF